jgi:hypothetical protein
MRNPALETDAVADIEVNSSVSASALASPAADGGERETFIWMQGRMFELLLRHDTASFERQFKEQKADPYQEDKDEDGGRSGGNAELQRYRDLAVVVYLRGELFEHILPLIKRRMSFEAPRQTQVEPLPAKGRVDWGRTAAANWRDWPGEVPLEVHTRQRRRHFATPENLLTVVTIMQYRQIVQQLLDNEEEYDEVAVLRHPLNEIADECNRELGFIHFAGLLSQSQAVLHSHTGAANTEELEQAVEENLLPGNNSAYFELLEWRHKLFGLHLLDRTQATAQPQTMLGNKRDNYLYQLWLFYEIFDFLNKEGKFKGYGFESETNKKRGKLQLIYEWGGRTYRLQHDQEIPSKVRQWNNAPGVRPDLYIERLDPPVQVLKTPNEGEIWRESGYMLDAKYYKDLSSSKAPGEPVKRMLTDLAITGTNHGALLFAFLGEAQAQAQPKEAEEKEEEKELAEAEAETKLGAHYEITPSVADPRAGVGQRHTIAVHRITPGDKSNNLQEKLRSLLQTAHEKLTPAPSVACHGFFLDIATSNSNGIGNFSETLLGLPPVSGSAANSSDAGTGGGAGSGSGSSASASASAGSPSATDSGLGSPDSGGNWLVCPKPHLGLGRADIVHHERDCLKNPYVCHLLGVGNSPATTTATTTTKNFRKPVLIPRKIEDLPAALDTLKSFTGVKDDPETVKAIEREFIAFTRRYAEMSGVDLNHYIQQFRDNFLHDVEEVHPLLTREHSETLALGKFLWDQLDKIKAHDYSGPGLHFSGVLEALVSATVFTGCSGLVGSWVKVTKQTLGTLPYIRTNQSNPAHNHREAREDWPKITGHAAKHWKETVSAEPAVHFVFDDFVKHLDSVAQLRNKAAHPGHFERKQLLELWQLLFVRNKSANVGMLPALLICWQ